MKSNLRALKKTLKCDNDRWMLRNRNSEEERTLQVTVWRVLEAQGKVWI